MCKVKLPYCVQLIAGDQCYVFTAVLGSPCIWPLRLYFQSYDVCYVAGYLDTSCWLVAIWPRLLRYLAEGDVVIFYPSLLHHRVSGLSSSYRGHPIPIHPQVHSSTGCYDVRHSHVSGTRSRGSGTGAHQEYFLIDAPSVHQDTAGSLRFHGLFVPASAGHPGAPPLLTLPGALKC